MTKESHEACWVADVAYATSQVGRGRLYSHMEPQGRLSNPGVAKVVCEASSGSLGDLCRMIELEKWSV